MRIIPYQIIDSALSGFGSKGVACKQFGLHEYIPILTNNKQIYVEHFLFSAIMFFNVQCRTAIINDKLDLIPNFWKVIKEQRKAFEEELQYVWLGKYYFDEYKQRTDAIGKAVYLYLMDRGSHKGILEHEFRYKPFNHPIRKEFQEWEEIMNKKASLAIWNLDFRDSIQKLLNNGTESYQFVHYLDPPYYKVNRYLLNFTDQDHADLHYWLEELRKNPYHHIILSYNDHEMIRKLYKDWYILKVEWMQSARDLHSIPHTELLISNKPLKRYVSKMDNAGKMFNKQNNLSNLLKK